ncbi:MAG: CsgG/HfaB family protein [Bacteroidota bacterium]
MKKLFTLLPAIIFAAQSFAQKQEKFTFEQVKAHCADMPLSKRARISVTRFNVTTTSANDAAAAQNAHANNKLKALSLLMGGSDAPKADGVPTTLAGNMSTTLTHALQDIGCYRVLETKDNNGDLTGEIDQGDSKYASKKVPKAGKQLGPQIAVTGELTEYSIKDKGMSIVGVGTNKKLVKIGFILKLINIETRDIIATRLIRVQSKTSGSVSVLGGLVSTNNSDPAIAAVMDDGILEAVRYMAHVRDSLNITVDNIPGSSSVSSDGTSEIEVSLTNASYTSFTDVAGVIGSLPGYKSMEKSFSSGVATYTVVHSGTADDFSTALGKNLGKKYEMMGSSNDKIELKVK